MDVSLVSRMDEHVQVLARRFGYSIIHPVRSERLQETFKDIWADLATKEISIIPITGSVAYACALHEFGHIATHEISSASTWAYTARNWNYYILNEEPPSVVKDTVLISEIAATRWAIQNAICITPQMKLVWSMGIRTYTTEYTRRVRVPE